jgi:hypothetical protein
MNIYLYIAPNYFCKIITAFKARNHRLPVEIGRWTGVPLNERKCCLCELNENCDEFRYLLSCHYFREYGIQITKQYFYKKANIIKFSQQINIEIRKQLTK